MNKKTLELLLTNYTNINNQLRTPCAEKSKFEKLIKDVELKIKELQREVIYYGGMKEKKFDKKKEYFLSSMGKLHKFV